MLPAAAGLNKRGCELLATRWIVFGVALNLVIAAAGIWRVASASSPRPLVGSLDALYADVAATRSLP